MAYPTYTKEMVAAFSGRPVASYKTYTDTSAIPQAVLLFKMNTCLASLDDLSEDDLQLANFAILAMADQFSLTQQYQKAKASPFSSESIGSYSYSKAAAKLATGQELGVFWFDEAVKRLSVCDTYDDIPMSGGIEVFEHDALFVDGSIAANVRMLSPSDLDLSRTWGYDPAPVQ